MSDEQVILHMLNNLPKEYNIQISKLETQMDDTSKLLTIDKVQVELRLRYTRLKTTSQNYGEEGMEQAMISYHCFKGKCMKCGRIGHKAVQCQSSDQFWKKMTGLSNN